MEAMVCIPRQWLSCPALDAASGQSVHGLPVLSAVEDAPYGDLPEVAAIGSRPSEFGRAGPACRPYLTELARVIVE